MSERYEWMRVLAIVVCMIALTYVVATAYPHLTQSLAYQPETLPDKWSPPVKPMANPPATMPESRNANIKGVLTFDEARLVPGSL